MTRWRINTSDSSEIMDRPWPCTNIALPQATSRYEIKLSSKPGDVKTLAYEGKIWIDPENAELRRMTIVVP
jgi:hypothetical protein